MDHSGILDVSSHRGSWVWNWRNRNCVEQAEGSANKGTLSRSVKRGGGTRDGGVCIEKNEAVGFNWTRNRGRQRTRN